MQIHIPQPDADRLALHAAAAGYDNVENYVAELIQAQAQQPTPDELPTLSTEELQASIDALQQSEQDMAAGQTRDLREALLAIADKHGLEL